VEVGERLRLVGPDDAPLAVVEEVVRNPTDGAAPEPRHPGRPFDPTVDQELGAGGAGLGDTFEDHLALASGPASQLAGDVELQRATRRGELRKPRGEGEPAGRRRRGPAPCAQGGAAATRSTRVGRARGSKGDGADNGGGND